MGVSGPHGRGGRRAADSPVHRLPARTKLVALVVFVVAVVAAPPGAWWVYGVAATALALAVILARLDVTTVVRGLAIEIPFVVFALALPFVATGPRVAVPGLPDVTVSTHGLSAAATFLARATLGTLAAVVLASTTSPAHLVGGLRLLRLPGDVVLLPTAPALAMRELARLEQPFTTSEARQALGTTRRVAIPLLEHLDGRGWTRRVDGTAREVDRARAEAASCCGRTTTSTAASSYASGTGGVVSFGTSVSLCAPQPYSRCTV